MEYVTRSCICRGLEFAAQAASAARTACNPVRIRDVKGKKRTGTDFAFFGGEMCRVAGEAMPVPRRAVPLWRALSGLRGARPPQAVTHTGPRPAGSRAELSPRCHLWRCGGGVCLSVCVCVCLCVCGLRGAAWDSAVAAERDGCPRRTDGCGAVCRVISVPSHSDSGTAALSRPAWPQAAPLRNVTSLWFWYLWRLLLFV